MNNKLCVNFYIMYQSTHKVLYVYKITFIIIFNIFQVPKIILIFKLSINTLFKISKIEVFFVNSNRENNDKYLKNISKECNI